MKPATLIRIIQTGLTLLVVVMPFHALLSVSAGHWLGHQAAWQSWKEVLLLLLSVTATVLVYQQPSRLRRLNHPIWYLAAIFILIGLVVTAVQQPALSPVIYGIKTDYEFLVAAALAALVTDPGLVRRLTSAVIAGGGVVIAFGLLQITILPKDWLVHLGYGATTIQPYQLVDPAIGAVRILSTLGGPLQLGSYLLVPLGVVAWQLARRPHWWHALYLAVGIVVLWHTYSRAAYIGLGVTLAMVALIRLPRPARLPALLGVTVIAAVALQILLHASSSTSTLQYYVFHQNIGISGPISSSTQHSLASTEGLHAVAHNPWGMGLGTAGPASYHGTGSFIPEDYYLQLAYEAGVLGVLVFVAFEMLVAVRLWRQRTSLLAPGIVAAIAGVSAINLFLHGWADSSTALVAWTAAGACLGERA